MNVFVYEYASAQPLASDLPLSIRQEGGIMLDAAVTDFGRVVGVTTTTLPDGGSDEESNFKSLASRADWSFIIAPELERILEERCRWVEEAGGRLLGPASATVRQLADKWQLNQLLRAQGIQTPATWLASQPPSIPGEAYVRKLRWGAGSTGVRLVPSQNVGPATDDEILQVLVPGCPASIAVLIGPRGHCWLLPAEQRLSVDGCFTYRGGQVPLRPHLARRACRLAQRALAALEVNLPLRGYLGFDLVLNSDPAGTQDYVIEINLRLTTSYVGLRVLTRQNLMEALLRLQSGAVPAINLQWANQTAVFDGRGQVELITSAS